MRRVTAILCLAAACLPVACSSMDGKSLSGLLGEGALTDDTIVAGLKEALRVGTGRAVDSLSAPGGYLNDARVRIPVPDKLEKFASTLRKVGLGGEVDRFERAMNAAAESAATQAAPVFVDAIAGMTFDDARRILSGKQASATNFFRRNTTAKLTQLYAPVVREHMGKVGAVQLYDDLMARYRAIPLVPAVDFSLDEYVTSKALDGLFDSVADVEKDIRANPAARTTELLRRVFGSSAAR